MLLNAKNNTNYYADSDSDAEDKDINAHLATSQFLKALAKWAIQNRITSTALNELLVLLRKSDSFCAADIPKSGRTLLKTPKTDDINYVDKCDGKYAYLGIYRYVKNFVQRKKIIFKTNHLSVDINIDGLPISKSSSAQFWPILGRIVEFEDQQPFVIALYSGKSKPSDVNSFLNDFVMEMIQLHVKGMSINGTNITVGIRAVLCDAPARSFIKGIVGHTSKNGCERCTILGVSVNRRVVFLDQNCALRTDTGFRHDEYQEHRTSTSCMLDVPNIDMIKSFVLDSMHLVFLGTCRRILSFLQKGPKEVRLDELNIDLLSAKLINIGKTCTPSDFVRKPRCIQDVERWKATELRQFCLYTGIVVLKHIVSYDVYMWFVGFSVALRLLHLPDADQRNNHLDLARRLISEFIQNARILMGDVFISYNIHNLIHIADDVEHFNASLFDISCFPFESFLYQLKLAVNGGISVNPLLSAIKRLEERNAHGIVPKHMQRLMKVSTSRRDKFFISKSGLYCEVMRVDYDKKLDCLAIKLHRLKSFFTQPMDSRMLGIAWSDNMSELNRKRVFLHRSDVAQKLYTINYLASGLVFVPVISCYE